MLFGQKLLDNTCSACTFLKKTTVLTAIYLQNPWLWFADIWQGRQSSKNSFLLETHNCASLFCNENHGPGHSICYCFIMHKQECIVKHRLRRTWVSPICRTVSEWWCRKLINSRKIAGGVHGHLCFTKDRGEADLYEKYMAYCACYHLVTQKRRQKKTC